MQDWVVVAVIIGGSLIGPYFIFALKIADQWEKAIVLRFGRFRGLQGPGLFWIVPIVDRISAWIEHRVMVTPSTAERTLTKDTVPVDVDAVLFWLVWNAEEAAKRNRITVDCEGAEYGEAGGAGVSPASSLTTRADESTAFLVDKTK